MVGEQNMHPLTRRALAVLMVKMNATVATVGLHRLLVDRTGGSRVYSQKIFD